MATNERCRIDGPAKVLFPGVAARDSGSLLAVDVREHES